MSVAPTEWKLRIEWKPLPSISARESILVLLHLPNLLVSSPLHDGITRCQTRAFSRAGQSRSHSSLILHLYKGQIVCASKGYDFLSPYDKAEVFIGGCKIFSV